MQGTVSRSLMMSMSRTLPGFGTGFAESQISRKEEICVCGFLADAETNGRVIKSRLMGVFLDVYTPESPTAPTWPHGPRFALSSG